MKKLFFFVLLAFCATAVQAQTQELDNLSLSINNELTSLKTEIVSLQNDLQTTSALLTEQSNLLKISENERKDWEIKSTGLSASLTSINEALNKSYENLSIYKYRLKQHQKALALITILLLIMTAGKVAGYILYAKGIKLPRWLDILL